MSWLKNMFRRDSTEDEEPEPEVACTHMNLTAKWDEAADVGDADKATGYSCIACNESFTIEQAQALGRISA